MKLALSLVLLLLAFCLLGALILSAGVTEPYGPPSRQGARSLRTDRVDGTSQYLEFSLTPVPGVNGFTRIEVFTGKRENGKFARLKLAERDVQLPNVLRYARELYDFNSVTAGGGLAALAENRVVLISSTPSGTNTEFTLRSLSVSSLALGRSIVVPANPTGLALRPGSNEAWTIHSGNNNLIAISDLSTERPLTTLPLRLLPQAVAVALAFSPSGRIAYVVVRNAEAQSDRGSVQIWDCVTRTLRTTITLGGTQPASAALSPDGILLAISGNSLNELNLPSPSLSYLNTVSSTAEVASAGLTGVGTIVGNLASAEHLAFHPDGNRLFLLAPLSVDTFDVQSRRIVRSTLIPRSAKPNGIDVSPFGELTLLRDSLGQQSVLIDTFSGEILDPQPFPNGIGFLVLRP